jgi:hypothetical protein
VHAFQDGLTATALSSWGKTYTAPKGSPDPTVDAKTPPVEQVAALDAGAFFSMFGELTRAEDAAGAARTGAEAPAKLSE